MCEQGQEKWSSVRITDSKKNSIKVENHISVHSNLNLNGLISQESDSQKHRGLGKEVTKNVKKSFLILILFNSLRNFYIK